MIVFVTLAPASGQTDFCLSAVSSTLFCLSTISNNVLFLSLLLFCLFLLIPSLISFSAPHYFLSPIYTQTHRIHSHISIICLPQQLLMFTKHTFILAMTPASQDRCTFSSKHAFGRQTFAIKRKCLRNTQETNRKEKSLNRSKRKLYFLLGIPRIMACSEIQSVYRSDRSKRFRFILGWNICDLIKPSRTIAEKKEIKRCRRRWIYKTVSARSWLCSQ